MHQTQSSSYGSSWLHRYFLVLNVNNLEIPLFRRGAFQDRLLRDAVFARAEEEERTVWQGLQGAVLIYQ